jgi:two-component system, NarL family, sensor kinase
MENTVYDSKPYFIQLFNYFFLQETSFGINHLVTGVAIGVAMLLFIAAMLAYFIVQFVQKQKTYQYKLQLLKKETEAQILQSQLEIQEQTFTAISEEIHDNVGQILSLAKMQLNIVEEENIEHNELLADAKLNISRALADLRDVAKNLHSSKITQQPLLQSLELEVHRIQKIIPCSLSIIGVEPTLNDKVKLLVFRIFQEACNNALKHAKATNIAIVIHFNISNCVINISDDGIGFDVENSAIKNGLGLQNIYKRMMLANGNATIESMPNKGTIIKLQFPYE